jgi:general secretion pathway protein D
MINRGMIRRAFRGPRLIGLLLVAAALVSAQPPAPAPGPVTQAAQPAPTVPGGLNLNNASLLEVINLLAQDLHINYIIDPAVKGGSVTINTYGTVHDVDLMPLLQTILRMNGLSMVQVGNVYRIIPLANIPRQPISPVTETDPSKLPDDERPVLNLVFLHYMTSGEMYKILLPFIGEGAQVTSYDPANLLIILDNSRNMRRSLELVSLFDSDTFAGQRVRAYDTKNVRPTDLAKDLDSVFQAYALSDKNGAVRFLGIDRINTILAIAPNPGAFAEVDKWLAKLDIPARVQAGSIDNYVYKLKYARAEIIGGVILQLYGGAAPGLNYPGLGNAAGLNATGMNGGGIYGASLSGQGGASPYVQNGGLQGGAVNQFGNNTANTAAAGGAPLIGGAATGGAVAGPGVTGLGVNGPTDATGTFLGANRGFGYNGPRIIPNPYDNTLLVQGTPVQWDQIKRLVEQLDVSPRQVLIDAKIYEINLTGDLSAGVEAFLQKANTPNATVPAHQLLGNTIGNASGPGLNLTAGLLVGQTRQLLGYLQANETTTKAKVLSAPSVIATDSIPASITVGDTVPTLTSTAASGVQVGGTTQFANTVSNASTGIGLNILARVNPSGVVTMVINQNVTAPIPNPLSNSGSAGANINSPSFSNRNVSTQITCEDGDTVAIGGIIEESTTDANSGIPFLDRMPYLGFLFGTKSHTTSRTELIIFLTPRVIYDTTQLTDATQELKDKVRGLRKMITE